MSVSFFFLPYSVLMVKFGTWNIRGLNNPLKHNEVASFICFHKLSLFGLVETKIRSEFLDSLVRHCFPNNWISTHNLGNEVVTRIIVAWDPSIMKISSVFSSPQLILLHVEALDCHKCF